MVKKKKTEKKYKGNPPGTEGWILGGLVRGEANQKSKNCNWKVYLRFQDNDWISIKAASCEPNKRKANFWLGYNPGDGVFANGREFLTLREFPRLKKNLFNLLEKKGILEAAEWV